MKKFIVSFLFVKFCFIIYFLFFFVVLVMCIKVLKLKGSWLYIILVGINGALKSVMFFMFCGVFVVYNIFINELMFWMKSVIFLSCFVLIKLVSILYCILIEILWFVGKLDLLKFRKFNVMIFLLLLILGMIFCYR